MRKLLQAIRNESKHYDSIWEMIYLSDFMDPFYNTINWFRSKKEMIARMLFWGWKLRWSWDFDASTMYEITYLKLSRVHDCMKKHGHLVWNANHNSNLMRKLAETKMLAKKLSEDDYHRYYSQFHNQYKREDEEMCELDKMMGIHYPDAKSINSKLYSFMIKKAFASDALEKKNDKNRFYYLLNKYQDHWWD